jgi:hypothetical protein
MYLLHFLLYGASKNALRTSHKYDTVSKPKVRGVCRTRDRGGRVGCGYDVTNTDHMCQWTRIRAEALYGTFPLPVQRLFSQLVQIKALGLLIVPSAKPQHLTLRTHTPPTSNTIIRDYDA